MKNAYVETKLGEAEGAADEVLRLLTKASIVSNGQAMHPAFLAAVSEAIAAMHVAMTKIETAANMARGKIA